ncbi:hypothetical protein EV368DRAFT_64036 [Lentinula lateritia]|uniref:Uncharacterized protein n=1 Tax=Lentinula aff. lateritia TaxID=2804960 RepID=A0ACC1TTK5_9AGAR|nr:hypothetical protein F5876DRAFT_79211 [Lentinula aff. lateritia]KAJ3853494.1 hypothetical protein EV368DRAFT_64036 [Lentinula lateritia]
MHLEITLSRFFVHQLNWTLKRVFFSGILLLGSFFNTLRKKDLVLLVLEFTCSAVLMGCFMFLLRRALTPRRRSIRLDDLESNFPFGSIEATSVMSTCPICLANEMPLLNSLALGPPVTGSNSEREQTPTSKFLKIIPLLASRPVTLLEGGDEEVNEGL